MAGMHSKCSCSIIIPCFNEEGNIAETIKQAPKIGKFTEIIVVDDASTDNSKKIAQTLKKKIRNLKIVSHKKNQGKGPAVKTGINAAKGDVVIVWDADRTVPANELHLFYEALVNREGAFANGTRMVYPMEKEAMRPLNSIGNALIPYMFSWILENKISDTLCGTKALWKKDAKKIELNKDRWGDFDLLFGAARLNLKIVEVPVHYRARIAGESKMKTIRYAFSIGKIALRGIWEFKLRPLLQG